MSELFEYVNRYAYQIRLSHWQRQLLDDFWKELGLYSSLPPSVFLSPLIVHANEWIVLYVLSLDEEHFSCLLHN